MRSIFVSGLGAVSPAGWDVAALERALQSGKPLPSEGLARPGWERPLRVRRVPQPVPRPGFFGHPRLRRSSPITQYVVSAALEALQNTSAHGHGQIPCGLIVCLQSGCVDYSYRFFEEVTRDPATAGPLLFPETVFAAPASHAAACLPNVLCVETLVGDPSCFLQGLALGARWLLEERVAACLVLAAEETNWLLADALWHFEHSAIISAGAGAICLSPEPALSIGVQLDRITQAHTYTRPSNRARSARAMRAELPPGGPSELLCDGQASSPRADRPEAEAWAGWPGIRLSPRRILGEGLMAAAGWQCVAACQALANRHCSAANLSLVGANQQAVGARFVPVPAGPVTPFPSPP